MNNNNNNINSNNKEYLKVTTLKFIIFEKLATKSFFFFVDNLPSKLTKICKITHSGNISLNYPSSNCIKILIIITHKDRLFIFCKFKI